MFLTRKRHRSSVDGDTIGRRRVSRSRWAAVGAAVAVSFGGGGLFQVMASGSDIAAPAVFVATTPCRLLDTRAAPLNVGSRVTPLGPNSTYTTSVIGTNGNCVIPDDAASLVMNVTVSNQSASSYLTVYNPAVARPTTSSLNWAAASGDVANAVTASISPSGEISFYNNRGTTDLIADVVGYYTAGPLKNVYTKAQVDALIAAVPAAVGPVGPTGATGATGASGTTGIDGATGATGPQGLSGTRGLVGPAGAAGDSVLSTLSCTSNQVIRFVAGAWTCSDDSDILAGLHCTANQSPGFDGTNWVCRSAPIVSTLSRPAFSGPGFGVNSVFTAHSPNVQDAGFCDDFNCRIRLIDVLDHTGCSVAFTGNSRESNIIVTVTPTYIELDHLLLTDQSQPLYVTITCGT